MDDCFKILDESYARASKHLEKPFIADAGMQAKIEAVGLCLDPANIRVCELALSRRIV